MLALLALVVDASSALDLVSAGDVPSGALAAVRTHLAPWLSAGPDLTISLGSTSLCPPNASLAGDAFEIVVEGTLVCARGGSSLGIAYAAYAVLERLGFAFLHPLQPIVPIELNATALASGVRVAEAPEFAWRGFHVHTEHPLELVEVLQGSDATLGDGSVVSWGSMVAEVGALCEWLVANRQDRFEWVLLTTPEWAESGWVNSTERQHRLRNLTSLAHSFGLAAGVDVPIAEVQQRGWYMVNTRQPLPAMTRQIEARVAWLLDGAGFDFINSESGFTEFEHPSCDLMLRLINALGSAVAKRGKRASIKCHASTGQTCPDFPDPRTGAPLNFNFLPMLANVSMGVQPHTVQAYALDDPTGGAYGNDNFTALRQWMAYEAANDTREVVFHPETNYWVNVDVDVPLFLPLYGERRLHDMRLLVADEHAGAVPSGRVSGQNIFDSGWEWGAWLSDVLAAKAAWAPSLGLPDQADPEAVLRAALEPIGAALTAHHPPSSDSLVALLARLASEQRRLLILGQASPPSSTSIGLPSSSLGHPPPHPPLTSSPSPHPPPASSPFPFPSPSLLPLPRPRPSSSPGLRPMAARRPRPPSCAPSPASASSRAATLGQTSSS